MKIDIARFLALRPNRPAPGFHPRERFLRVFSFFLGVVLQIYIFDIFLPRMPLLRWYLRRGQMQRWVGIARRFRLLAIELGGMQIKLGQFLSSRADIVPDAVRRELAGLQDEVPPAPPEHVLHVIVSELGAPPQEIFQSFDPQAVAAASLGQVHFATLQDGRPVAVKVQRPAIDDIIEVDLQAISWVVQLIKNYAPIRRRVNMEALLAEFGRVLRQELDYVQEAGNANRFRQHFAKLPGVYIPEPILELTRRRVLVMERIDGVKVNDFAALDRLGVNRQELASRLNAVFLQQFYELGQFHADPHPGNLFVRLEPVADLARYERSAAAEPALTLPDGEQKPKADPPFSLIILDFGMVGTLPPQTTQAIQDAVIGLVTNDAARIVAALDTLHMILPGADKRPIEKAVETMLRHAFNRTIQEMTDMDVDLIMDEMRDIIYDLPFQIPQDLLFLGRALSMLGGLSLDIWPGLNMFAELQPFAKVLLDRERANTNWFEQAQKEAQDIGRILLNLPRQMDAYYKAANRGELQTRSDFSRLERGMRRVERSTDRLAGGMVAASLFLGGVELRTRGLEKEASRAWAGAAAAAIWAFWPRGER